MWSCSHSIWRVDYWERIIFVPYDSTDLEGRLRVKVPIKLFLYNTGLVCVVMGLLLLKVLKMRLIVHVLWVLQKGFLLLEWGGRFGDWETRKDRFFGRMTPWLPHNINFKEYYNNKPLTIPSIYWTTRSCLPFTVSTTIRQWYTGKSGDAKARIRLQPYLCGLCDLGPGTSQHEFTVL